MKTLKTSGLILLLAVMLIQSNIPLIIYSRFELNRAEIAANLCVNRSNPSMHCNGHCYLVKEMQKQEKNTPDPFAVVYQKMLLLCLPEERLPFFNRMETPAQFPGSLPAAISTGFYSELFRPPADCIKA